MRSSSPFRDPDSVVVVGLLVPLVRRRHGEAEQRSQTRLQQLFKGSQFAIRWGFIPLVIYVGFTRDADPGMPVPSVLSLLWG